MTKQFWIVSKDHSDPDFGAFDTKEQAINFMKLYVLKPEAYNIIEK